MANLIAAGATAEDARNHIIAQREEVDEAEYLQEEAYDKKTGKADTNSEAFKNWFGDSKVVDAEGKPLVMYHGTPNATFEEFRTPAYFTPNKQYAEEYKSINASYLGIKQTEDNPDVYPVYLSIKNPFDTRDERAKQLFYEEYYRQLGVGSDLSEKGLPDWMEAEDLHEWLSESHPEYDGLIIDEGGTGGYGMPVIDRGEAYLPFDPKQIKSVYNRGTWDKNNANIYYQEITQDNPKYTIEKKAEYSNRTEIIPSRLKKTPKKFARQIDLTEEAKSKLNTVIAPISIVATEDVGHISNKDFKKLILERITETNKRRYVQLSDGNFALVSKNDAHKMTNTSVSFEKNEFRNINKHIILNIEKVTKTAILTKEHEDLEGSSDLRIRKYIAPVFYKNNIYVAKLTIKEYKQKRDVFSEELYKKNGNRDFGEYNIEVVKKLSPLDTSPVKQRRQQEGTNDSIDNTNQFVKGFLFKEYLAGISDDTGTYYTEEKTTNRQGQSTKSFLQETVKQINKTNAQIVNESAKAAEQMLEEGATAEQVQEATGWVKDEDGLHFDVNDDEVSVNDINEIVANKKSGQLTLGDLISYPKLFRAYPFLQNLPVDFAEGYNRFFNGIQLERKQLTDGTLKRDICRMLDSYTKNEGRPKALQSNRQANIAGLGYEPLTGIDATALADKGYSANKIAAIVAINEMTPKKPHKQRKSDLAVNNSSHRKTQRKIGVTKKMVYRNP